MAVLHSLCFQWVSALFHAVMQLVCMCHVLLGVGCQDSVALQYLAVAFTEVLPSKLSLLEMCECNHR